MELEMLDGRRLAVQTQWINRTNDGMYAIGCRFIEPAAATQPLT